MSSSSERKRVESKVEQESVCPPTPILSSHRATSSVILPESHPLVHSFSQPELYYQSFSPAARHNVVEPFEGEPQPTHVVVGTTSDGSRSRRGIDIDLDTSVEEGELHPLCALTQPTLLGPPTYQFHASGSGAITSSPTMAQHAETHQVWKDELREEQRQEAEDELAAEKRRNAMAEGDTNVNETTKLLRPTPSPTKGRRRPRSITEDDDTSSDGDELPQLSVIELIALCLPAAAVMIGWAVGEALLLPYLLSLGVSPTVANFAFLSVCTQTRTRWHLASLTVSLWLTRFCLRHLCAPVSIHSLASSFNPSSVV
jgi:hypothetical protein